MNQVSYVQSFNEKLACYPPEIPSTHEGTHTKPMTLLGMPVELSSASVPEPSKITVKLKSIRAPKFSVSYTAWSNDSVFSLKERLVSDPEKPMGDAQHGLSSIRLLLKSKAVGDTKALRDLPSHDFTVMFSGSASQDSYVPVQVYWPEDRSKSTSESEPVEATPKPESTPNDEEMFQEIAQVLSKYGRSDLLAKFKAAVHN